MMLSGASKAQNSYKIKLMHTGISKVKNPFGSRVGDVVIKSQEIRYIPWFSNNENAFYVYGKANEVYQLKREQAGAWITPSFAQIELDSLNYYEYYKPNTTSGNWFYKIVAPNIPLKLNVSCIEPLDKTAVDSLAITVYNFNADSSELTIAVNGTQSIFNINGLTERKIHMPYKWSSETTIISFFSPFSKMGITKISYSGVNRRIDSKAKSSAYAFAGKNKLHTQRNKKGDTEYFSFIGNHLNLLSFDRTDTRANSLDNVIVQYNQDIDFVNLVEMPIIDTVATCDYLVIVNEEFLNQSNDIISAVNRLSPNLLVKIINAQTIYDYYSCSSPSAAAIKRFIATQSPRYVLLIGDANVNTRISKNVIPGFTYYQNYKHATITSDYPYCYQSDPEQPTIAVGRLPFDSSEELRSYFQKLNKYLNNNLEGSLLIDDLGVTESWSKTEKIDNLVCFKRAERGWLQNLLSPGFIALINSGEFNVLEYVGHGAFDSWSDKDRIDANTINQIGDGHVFQLVDLSCWTGDFAHRDKDSFSEHTLKIQLKGPISIISASGFTSIASYNNILKFINVNQKSMDNGTLLNMLKKNLFEKNELDLDDMYAFNVLGFPNIYFSRGK